MVALRSAALAAALALLAGAAEAQTVSSLTDATTPLTNQEYLYIVQNGQPRRVHPSAIVPTGLTIPTADLLGGLNNAFTLITVGSNLSLSAGILSMPVPTADLLGGIGNAFTQITVGSELTPGSVLNLTTTGVVAGSYTNADLTVDEFGRLTAVANGSDACADVTATAVIFSDGSTCVGDYPNFVYSSTNGQVRIINKQTVSIDPLATAGLIVEAPNVQLHGAIQFGESNISGSGPWGMLGWQDTGSGRDGPYAYLNTSAGDPIVLGSVNGAEGAPRVWINSTDCMVADIGCHRGDLQIHGRRQDHQGDFRYWVLVFGDGPTVQGGFKLDTSGYGYFELGRSETSTFVPHVHIAENGLSYISGFGTTPYLGVGINTPGTMLDVNGDITDRAVLTCNAANNAVQTDATGKLTCGVIPAGAGGVTASGTLTANRLIIGGGTSVVSALGSLGTTTTVLHGNAAGAPTFGAVSLTADVSGILPATAGGTGINNGSNTLTVGGATSLPSAPASTQCLHIDSGGAISATGSDCGAATGGGGMSLISTQTANNTATSISWTGLTAGRYVLKIENLVPATVAADIVLQFGEGGTPTWETANYAYYYNFASMTSVDAGAARNSSTSSVNLASGLTNTAGIHGATVNFYGLSSSTKHAVDFSVELSSNATGNDYWINGAAIYTGDTNAITAVRLITSSGNLNTGRASLYVMN